MQDYSYSVFSLAAIVIHLIINLNCSSVGGRIHREVEATATSCWEPLLIMSLMEHGGYLRGLAGQGACMSRPYSSSSRLSHLFSCGDVLSSPILNSAKGRLVFSPCSGMRFWPSTSWQLQPTHSTDASFISIPKAFTKQVTCEIQPSTFWLPSMFV